MNENGNSMVMPVGPVGGYGGGSGLFGGDGGIWALAILFLLFGGMWGGNGFGGNGANGMYPWLNQADVTTSGFGNLQTALCGGFAGVNSNIANGFAQAEIAANARQIADMQQAFAAQTANTAGLSNISSQLATCCCENRLATANLQSVIQAENCADRAAIADALNVVRTDVNAGIQSIKDQMCQDTINRLTTENNQLRDAATRSNIENYVQNALTAQTQYITSLYPPTATTPAA